MNLNNFISNLRFGNLNIDTLNSDDFLPVRSNVVITRKTNEQISREKLEQQLHYVELFISRPFDQATARPYLTETFNQIVAWLQACVGVGERVLVDQERIKLIEDIVESAIMFGNLTQDRALIDKYNRNKHKQSMTIMKLAVRPYPAKDKSLFQITYKHELRSIISP